MRTIQRRTSVGYGAYYACARWLLSVISHYSGGLGINGPTSIIGNIYFPWTRATINTIKRWPMSMHIDLEVGEASSKKNWWLLVAHF